MESVEHHYSTVTNRSLGAAIVGAFLHFAGSLIFIRTSTTVPTLTALFLTIFGPFAVFFVLAAIVHRRSFVFNEATGLLTIQELYFLCPVGAPWTLPIERIGQVVFIERRSSEGDGGSVAIQIGQRSFEVFGSSGHQRHARLTEIREVVDRARRRNR
jgi:hypothetical protein